MKEFMECGNLFPGIHKCIEVTGSCSVEMITPQDRTSEKIKETESIIKNANEVVDKLNLPAFAKKIQLDSFDKKLNALKKESEDIHRTS